MRLENIEKEYRGRVRLVNKAFPLEVYGGGPPDRQELELEIWLAAIQEPRAVFKPFGQEWPITTLPAFDAAWCAFQQGEDIGRDFDLRIRRAFFAEGRNIGRPDVMFDLAREAGLDLDLFTRQFYRYETRQTVLAEGASGRDTYQVRGTPTVMLPDGTRLRHPIAYPRIEGGKILSVGRTPCCGESCDQPTRELFEKALALGSNLAQPERPNQSPAQG